MWFIGVKVEQETSAPPPKKNPGSAPVYRYSEQLPANGDLLQSHSALEWITSESKRCG